MSGVARFVSSGDRISDNYVLDDLIGQGGMALVHRATDTRHGRQVAIKFLRPDLSASIGQERFRREIEIAARLSHPHIVPVHDSGEWNGSLYYVMPLVEGHDLGRVIKNEGALPLERALSIARDVGQALAYAHQHGVVHRDIKPGNIMLTEDYAVVADFGVAKAIDDAVRDDLTRTDAALGTPRYMAPEQATDAGTVTHSSDVYSLGCVVYEMLTGSPPFTRRSGPAVIAEHLMSDPPSATDLNPSVPAGVANAIQQALAKQPEDRFGDVTQFVDTLQARAELSSKGWTQARSGGSKRTIAGALVTVAIGLLIFALVTTGGGAPEGWVNGKPTSVLVLPFATSATTAEERAIASALSEELRSELNEWDSVRTVPSVALAGPMFDRGILGGAIERLDDAIALAGDLGVAAVALITVSVTGDSARVESNLYDATPRWFGRQGRLMGAPLTTRAPTNAGFAFVEPIARRILGLESTIAESLSERRRESRVPGALQQADEGQRLLESWRLVEAAQRYSAAIAMDSTFATAHLRLAQTLYWLGVEDPTALASFGDDSSSGPGAMIFRASSSAARHAAGLDGSTAAHVTAFQHFAEGDYAAARAAYQAILERDNADVYAWLLLGSVEFRDPWLSNEPGTGPRADWNLAMEAFQTAVRLQPAFQLGYGHVFDIHGVAASVDSWAACRGFEVARDVLIAPWDQVTPDAMEPYCLVASDSLRWVPQEEWSRLDLATARAGAETLLEIGTRLLSRWAAFAPTSARPLEELARATIAQRGRLGPGPPNGHRALAQNAVDYRERALSLDSDTLAGDIFELASLYLAAGNIERGLALNDLGTAFVASTPERAAAGLPPVAGNVWLSVGQAREALRAMGRQGRQRFARDPETGRVIPYGTAFDHISRVGTMGGVLVGGTFLRDELTAIREAWAGPSYTDADRALLRLQSAPTLLAGLVLDDAALIDWVEGLDVESDPVLSAAVRVARADPEAEAAVVEVADSLILDGANVQQAFVVGSLALRVDALPHAIHLLSRIDSIPLPPQAFDARWGSVASARLLRAEAYAALGDTARALAELDGFERAWQRPDELTRAVSRRANDLADRIRRPR